VTPAAVRVPFVVWWLLLATARYASMTIIANAAIATMLDISDNDFCLFRRLRLLLLYFDDAIDKLL